MAYCDYSSMVQKKLTAVRQDAIPVSIERLKAEMENTLSRLNENISSLMVRLASEQELSIAKDDMQKKSHEHIAFLVSRLSIASEKETNLTRTMDVLKNEMEETRIAKEKIETELTTQINDQSTLLAEKDQEIERLQSENSKISPEIEDVRTKSKQLKEKEEDVEKMKKDLASANEKVTELLGSRQSFEDGLRKKMQQLEQEKGDIQSKATNRDNSFTKLKKEVKFLRQHLKDTEDLLSMEGGKVKKTQDEMDKCRNDIADLEYAVGKRDIRIQELEKMVKEKEVRILSLARAAKPTPLKIQSPTIAEPENIDPKSPKHIRKRRKPDIFDTTTDQLLSEISFGSSPAKDFCRRTPPLVSSTPKVCAQPSKPHGKPKPDAKIRAKVTHKMASNGQKRPKYALPPRTKADMVKSNPKQFYDVYEFRG